MREIIAARLERLQRRIDQRLDLDETSRRRGHAALDREPHALRLVVEAPAFDVLDAQDKAVGVLALLAQFDVAADGHAGGGNAQHRVCDQRRAYSRDGEADSDCSNPSVTTKAPRRRRWQPIHGSCPRGRIRNAAGPRPRPDARRRPAKNPANRANRAMWMRRDAPGFPKCRLVPCSAMWRAPARARTGTYASGTCGGWRGRV
jgi:hypothetical protein